MDKRLAVKYSRQPQSPIGEGIRKAFCRDRRKDIGVYKAVAAVFTEEETHKLTLIMRQSTTSTELSQYTHAFLMSRRSSLVGSLVLGTLHSGRIDGVGIHVDMPILYGSVCGESDGVVTGGNVGDVGGVC